MRLDTRAAAGIQSRRGITDVSPMPTATVSESDPVASAARSANVPFPGRRLLAVAAVNVPGGAETMLLRPQVG
jgi:hypothetical protein